MQRKPTILVTGTGGQVGFALLRHLQGLGEIVGLDRTALDLGRPDRIREVVHTIRPTLIVNPAAHTAVDIAERERDLAMAINADAPRVLAEAAEQVGAALIHYSTDYVFDGMKAEPYVETDATNPLNVYGRSKVAGEQGIAAVGGRHLILRTSWVYSARGRNFLTTMLRLAKERDELNIVADQFGAPTWSETIAALTAHIVAQALAADDADAWWRRHGGLYHMTAAGAASWYEFATAIFEQARVERVPTVLPIPASAYPTPASRPVNSRLANDRFARAFGLAAPQWRDALRLCLDGMDG
ncbi:dTDP-4-dehydrorhamnose reductase [Burkholderia sp. Nafp2/4-1b]|uniref:dTDP-4-dehydrorhamnose reductase n=1 Tax=Burkholderia sp. Nafp2/4-1b TaxID=2116686 RepID=UPI000EF959E1|nr:dTDP-4-dehydrorhamnose reductase [Burkholderia sp. Nafp2/4-1b]RKT98789.1 dTDP-4-dehydrorhamnose reductase [Burkholderia sp. Nafp2/4-1b]